MPYGNIFQRNYTKSISYTGLSDNLYIFSQTKILNFHRKMCKYQLIDVKRSINRGNVLTFLLTILVSLGSISWQESMNAIDRNRLWKRRHLSSILLSEDAAFRCGIYKVIFSYSAVCENSCAIRYLIEHDYRRIHSWQRGGNTKTVMW